MLYLSNPAAINPAMYKNPCRDTPPIFKKIFNMKKIYFLFTFFFLTCICNCKKENFIVIEGVEPISFECLTPIKEHQVIDNEEAYQLFLAEYKESNLNCPNYVSPGINFTERTLVGQYIEATACSHSSISEVFADPSQKRYIYQLQVKLDGDCELAFEKIVWISVPKLPDNYTVKFEAIYERI